MKVLFSLLCSLAIACVTLMPTTSNVSARDRTASSLYVTVDHRHGGRHYGPRRHYRGGRALAPRRHYGPRYRGGSSFGVIIGGGVPYYRPAPRYFGPPPRYIAPRPRYIAPAPVRPAYGLSRAHYDWCYNRYRSYRAGDNTFQPYNGPRRPCYSPFS